jgi:hypothetical protein
MSHRASVVTREEHTGFGPGDSHGGGLADNTPIATYRKAISETSVGLLRILLFESTVDLM